VPFSPRADEVKSILEILESDAYADGPSMAKAVLKEAQQLLAMRDWVALSHRFGDGQLGINWAPFPSEGDAVKAAEKIALNGQFSVIRLNSSGALLANLTSSKRKGWCQTEGCGHADWMHAQDARGRGRCIESLPMRQVREVGGLAVSKHIVPYVWCEACSKRGFYDEHDADKALGRARAYRSRLADKAGTRRGMYRENRYYTCQLGWYHLTSMSRREAHA
jgi:hypothetical protein